MGCTFCATGTMGIKGELTAGEIVEQLVHARALSPIRNVVFMGMGVRAAPLSPSLCCYSVLVQGAAKDDVPPLPPITRGPAAPLSLWGL